MRPETAPQADFTPRVEAHSPFRGWWERSSRPGESYWTWLIWNHAHVLIVEWFESPTTHNTTASHSSSDHLALASPEGPSPSACSLSRSCRGADRIQAQVAEPDDKAKGVVVPISLTVDISGTPRSGTSPVFFFGDDAAQGYVPSGANENDEQSGTSAATTSARDDDSPMGKLAVPAGVGAVVLVIGGLTVYVLRRRRAA